MHPGRLAACAMLLALSQPAAADDTAVRLGARIYENNCANCHGDNLQNNSSIAFDLRRLKPDEHARFVASVQNGKNKMPPWKGVLDEEQIEQIWAYVRANVPP
jgi:cytochrome c6